MKKYLLACLLGFTTLLSTNELKSNSIVVQSRIITITIEGYAFVATAGPTSGHLQTIQIYNLTNGEMVRSTNCQGYSCSLSLVGLPSGNYIGYVVADNEVGTKKFKL